MSSGFYIKGSDILKAGGSILASRFNEDDQYDLFDVIYQDNKDLIHNAPKFSINNFTSNLDTALTTRSFVDNLNVPWAIKIKLPFIQNNSEQYGILKGSYPTFKTMLFEQHAASGDQNDYGILSGYRNKYYLIRRSDDALCIYSFYYEYDYDWQLYGDSTSTYYFGNVTLLAKLDRNYFKTNCGEDVVPYNYIVELQGGGGGGGGTVYPNEQIHGANLDGAGGGGGAYVTGVISFASPNWTFVVTCGQGGAGGGSATATSTAIYGKSGQQTGIGLLVDFDSKLAKYEGGIEHFMGREPKVASDFFSPIWALGSKGSLVAGGGTYGHIPVQKNSTDSQMYTRSSAAGSGGSSTVNTSNILGYSVNDYLYTDPISGLASSYSICRQNGAGGGGPTNNYKGQSTSAATSDCIGIAAYKNGYNTITRAAQSGGAGWDWGGNNPLDDGNFTGVGGGGASVSGRGGAMGANGQLYGTENGENGSGGAGAYSPYQLQAGAGGNGYFKIYY